MTISQPDIESVREYWDSRPCNIKHSNSDFGSAQYFHEVTERRYFVEPHIIDFCEFPKWKGKNVLEIGCGIGTDAEQFAKHGANYTGIELSEESLNVSKLRFQTLNLKGNFIQLDAEDADTHKFNSEFDLIYSFGVIHHTPSIERALIAIRNLATSRTQIKLMVYASNSYKQAMINEGLDQPEAQFGCPIANSFTQNEMHELMARTGFSNVRISQDHIFPFKIPEYKRYEYVKEPHFEVMPDNVFQTLKKNFGWHLLVNAYLE
jgi:SAM-dependent methyltransferase